MADGRILIIDDEPSIRFGIRDFLEQHGFAVDEAGSCREAEASFRAARPDAAILDYLLPDGDALVLLPRLREIDAGVPLLVLTGHGSIDLAVRAVKEGAEQFLTKPVDLPSLLIMLRRLLEARRDRQRGLAGRSRERREALDPFLGASKAIARLAEQARLVADSDRPILIQGETGSGKGVLARWLHAHGPRRDEAFVDLNCAGLMRELLESELFGHERGAFTGAVAAKVGLLEVGDRGTVFLDEIGDMDPLVQPKLLKVLEEKQIRRLGDVRERRVDIRLIAATHQDFAALVQQKRFRSDLYYRISTIPLALPPLRQRAEDVPILARAILGRLAAELGRGEVHLAPDAEEALRRYPWPGNIRELRNVLERAALLVRRDILTRKDLLFDAPGTPTADGYDTSLTLEELERRHIGRVLLEENGRVEAAAVRLGIPRSSLYQKIKRYGISVSRV
ncbi:MAG: sigma-54 dependent transcriptional regulator [Singulisphaera sp.]